MNKIVEKIGMPALLEQCAEEASELTHACLKLARKMREENPTPKTDEECVAAFIEEVADVQLCIKTIIESELVCSEDDILFIKVNKLRRWKERLGV